MSLSIQKIGLLALASVLFPLMAFANDRLVPNRPSHSHTPLACDYCHLRDNPEQKPAFKRVDNVLYLDECGTCHLAYQPEWLPKRSWTKLLGNLKDHFGEEVSLTPGQVRVIEKFVMKRTADVSKAALTKKVMADLGAEEAPIRIMDIPFVKKHHEGIGADVLARKSVRSLANCEACHISAHGGLYIKKHINIPD
ncbi:MAG: hypothetical protein A2600_05630 [Candidatus Lambdaproteobacteria bacterium RIFOXYD1_FULL_56_27]|uniref:Cytochrome C n=1 Tax=Candidatus Lambdaproteobacteria bacterium RIFOXYD2_FULL_56_26 TaxID=1817773 RepID=A0A1F6GRC0_9PROT|nr:MAG: hypothetical protein A2426_10835 [Candidatus Lambdaproteobacteria bacterium RIFOXYC1_FULL_56_13]OGH00682.1 MAG: hypothetical protein A2557_03335 [Candidatus Lambdaproteobacteria bacterium RIFOXYD2_FULL_56_26]OGH07849.1 MAG: hypothetical protein A2600_05630 [Candidatus Lambdaproteobacteria bacterium RIFOXYD1_FULL_56_27]